MTKTLAGFHQEPHNFLREAVFMFTILQKMGIADKATANFVLLLGCDVFLGVSNFICWNFGRERPFRTKCATNNGTNKGYA